MYTIPFRYNEAVLLEFGTSNELLKIANQVQEWFSKFILLKSTKSWHDISVKGNFAQKPCEGNQLLNWRNKGFKTILDVLLVSRSIVYNSFKLVRPATSVLYIAFAPSCTLYL